MTAKIITLSEAIKTDLDAAVADDDFSLSFSTEILWSNRNLELAKPKSNDIIVSIAPLMWWKQLDAAREQLDQCLVDIILRKKIELADQDRDSGDASEERVESLVELLDELATWFLPGGGMDGRLDSMESALLFGADEEDDLPTTEITVNWNRLDQGLFEAYFPLHYSVS